MARMRNNILPPVHPNAGIEAEYRAKLDRLVEEMARSYYHWVRAQYRETPPVLAQDATPARELELSLRDLGFRWRRRFDDISPRLADWFVRTSMRRASGSLQKILKDAKIPTVEFKMTPAMRDAFQATLAENVSLIKSIASEYHVGIQGAVMRSVTAGRDLAGLTKELQHRHGITERRAKLIALDQNNQATAAFVRVRQADLGLKAVWLHSAGGKEPRPTHVKNSGKPYDPAIGWLDPAVGRRIWPGTEINCRCVSRSIVKGFS